MIVIEFEPFHAELIHVRYEQLGEMPQFRKSMEQLNNTYAWTGVVDGQVIGCAGMVPLLPGVGEIWALFSDALPQHKVSMFKELKRHLEHLHAQGYPRLQTVVQHGFETGKRFVERLGFEFEGSMRKYINGETYDRYAKIGGE